MTYAGFWKRVAAYLVDGLIASLIMFLIWMVFGLLLGGNSLLALMSGWKGTVLSVLIFVTYYACLESSPWQATVGKKIFGLKVTDLNGQRISFLRALGRSLGFYVSMLIMYIGYLMCLWTKKKQCLHDLMASCLVIDTTPDKKQGCVIGVIIAFFCMLIAAVMVGILSAISLPQYTQAVEKSRAAEAMQALGDIATAEQIYYISNNRFTNNLGNLDATLAFPATGNTVATNSYTITTAAPTNVGTSKEAIVITATRKDGAYAGDALTLTIDANGSIRRGFTGNHGLSNLVTQWR